MTGKRPKFPLLEMMKAQEAQRVAPAIAPYREAVRDQMLRAERAEKTVRGLEKALGGSLAVMMRERIADELAAKVRGEIYKAAATAKRPDEPITVRISAQDVAFMSPRSIESMILQEYLARTMPSLGVRADYDHMMNATMVDIRIPPMGYRFAKMDA